MKKLTYLLLPSVFAAFTIIGCGPSAEEKAQAEQHMKDSIAAAVQKAMDDSLAMVKATQDSIAAVQAMQDSIARAVEDSIKNAAESNKPKPKPKPKQEPAPTKPEEVKPGQGRG